MIRIILPDGIVRKYQSGVTPAQIAQDISEGLAGKVLSASVNGDQVELSTPIERDAQLVLYTWDDALGKKAFWHSSAHLLAQAILEFYPQAKLSIGPAIDIGFYYDVDFGTEVFSEKDFQQIEQRILENARTAAEFKIYPVSKIEALTQYKSNVYKTELIKNLQDGTITFCIHDDFTDLCRGGHIPHTALIKAVKILNTSGAYWRGDEKNKQLTRIYGISFSKQKELDEYLLCLEEAKKNDHRKLGKSLGLFTFSDRVGAGLPLWLPKGAALRKRLENFLTQAQGKSGYEMVITPHIGHKDLYMTSGHWGKYGEDCFKPIATPHEGEEFLLKPMNCPHHCEIYRAQQWSYRDLPKRFAEFGTVYRYEQSGELHGLTRVRGFTQDDAHIFCTPDQLSEEFKAVIDLVLYVFRTLGFTEYIAQVSLRDPQTPDRYIGSEEHWKKAESAIMQAVEENGLKAVLVRGEAAFYGPKLDFIIKDALGRHWQLGTIQVDYNLPERFDLHYKGPDNEFHRPVMIHRASFGSLERFIAILLEHTSGDLPLWLTPNQAVILPISEKHLMYAEKILNLLSQSKIRAFIDDRNEKTGKKIRDAEINKVPFMIIVGDKEQKCKEISVRQHGQGDLGRFAMENFLDLLFKKMNVYLKS
ncbi:MAG: threonine--tRNA ligase [Flavobacteriales bacterium AspAUS03]